MTGYTPAMRRFAMGALLFVGLTSLALGCESRVSLGGRCTRREECAALLTCVGGLCREECTGPSECPAGQRCIAGPSGVRACTRPLEETCDATDPCDPSVFAECREGRCVTGCTDGSTCVSAMCDTSGAVGVCVEPISTGRADAGSDASEPLDAAALDAGPERCLPEPPTSARTLAEAVLGSGARARRDDAEAWVGTASAPLPVGMGGTELAVGVRAAGPSAPRVLVAVGLGSHERGQPEIVIRRISPFDAPSFTAVPDLDAAIQLGALSVHSGPDFANLAVVRPRPESLDAAFVWMLREGSSPASLTRSSSTFPGRIALFEGPPIMFGRELLLLDELRGSTHVLSLVGEPFTPDNATQRELPAAWGTSTFTMSAARQAVLLHDSTQARTLLARSTGVTGSAPDLSLDDVPLVTDAPPALLATADSPARYRVVTGIAECDELPISDLTCMGSCSVSPPTTAISSTSVAFAFEATSWGEASVVLLFEPEGARLVVLDVEGGVVSEPIRLETTEMFEIDALSLREAHVAASVSDGVAVLVLAGLYANRAGDGLQVLVRSVRLQTMP